METIEVEGKEYRFDSLPNRCPQCHHAIDPRIIARLMRSYEPMGSAVAEVVFQCPQKTCRRAFIGRYTSNWTRSPTGDGHLFRLRATTPYQPEKSAHSGEVIEVSAQFVSVYDEAAAAEVWGLQEVVGCGYRKALEFLIKDYCILQQPSRAEEIKSKFLGRVIEDHIDDQNIKACAKRATWLGNDETHYVRRWTDKDLEDLKGLVALTESWITTAERTRKYVQDMSE